MPLNNLRNRIQKLQKFNLESSVTAIINSNSDYLANLLSLQLAQGKDADNQNVTVFGRDYYSDSTVFEKTRHGSGLGKVTDRITNYMSGAFYIGLKVFATDKKFIFTSNVPYFEDILTRSGTHRIIELNEEHLNQFKQEILFPQLKQIYNGL